MADWIRIEREYRAGESSLRQIARQEGISDAAIRKRAKTEGWLRQDSQSGSQRGTEQVRGSRVGSRSRRVGRPTVWTEATRAEFLLRIGNGDSVRAICRDKAMPSESTVYAMLAKDREFSETYRVACEARAESWIEEILTICDTGTDVRRDKLRIDVRRWLMAKLMPRRYGEPETTNIRESEVCGTSGRSQCENETGKVPTVRSGRIERDKLDDPFLGLAPLEYMRRLCFAIVQLHRQLAASDQPDLVQLLAKWVTNIGEDLRKAVESSAGSDADEKRPVVA